MDPRDKFFAMVFSAFTVLICLSVFMLVFILWVKKKKDVSGMVNQGFPLIYIEKDGKKYLKRRLRKKN